MSDLAPFVAATLRDKVVADLQDENQKLREIMADWESGVRCTGVHGVPIYAHGHLNSTKPNDHVTVIEDPGSNNRRRIVRLESVADAKQQHPWTADELKNTEIHIGHPSQYVPMGKFEMCGHPCSLRQNKPGRTYLCWIFRNWQNEFNYVEVRLEIGPYEQGPLLLLDFHQDAVLCIDQLFETTTLVRFGNNDMTYRLMPGGLVEVKFLEIILHEYMESQEEEEREQL